MYYNTIVCHSLDTSKMKYKTITNKAIDMFFYQKLNTKNIIYMYVCVCAFYLYSFNSRADISKISSGPSIECIFFIHLYSIYVYTYIYMCGCSKLSYRFFILQYSFHPKKTMTHYGNIFL